MNGTIDATLYTQGSKYQDCFMAPQDAAPLGFPQPWAYYRLCVVSVGWTFEVLPGDRSVCIDELLPGVYSFQTPEKAIDWVRRLTKPQLMCVEWGLQGITRDLISQMIAADRENLITWLQECYYLGKPQTHTDLNLVFDFYSGLLPMQRVSPVYIVSNDYTKPDYAAACAYNTGSKNAFDREVMHRFAEVQSWSAFLWGAGYKHPAKDVVPNAQPVAVQCWDENLVAVYAQYGRKL